MLFVECVSAACAEASGQKKWTLAHDKATAHWNEQRSLRTLRDLRDQLSLTKLCAQGPQVPRNCLCAECKEFRKKIPSIHVWKGHFGMCAIRLRQSRNAASK